MISTVIEVCRLGGDIQLQHYKNHFSVSRKESQSSILTDVDMKSESAMIGWIRKKHPGHNILSEESGFHFSGSEYTWILDPIDGTSNFAASLPWFGVLVALARGAEIIMAAACLPVMNEMYTAEKGGGAWLNSMERLHVSGRGLKDSLVGFSCDYTGNHEYLSSGLDFYRFLIQKSRNTRSTNSLVDFLNVAQGSYGGCVNLACGIWDIAAPSLIISEAGGYMKSLDGKDLNLTPSRDSLKKNYPVACGNIKVMEELLGYIQKNPIKLPEKH